MTASTPSLSRLTAVELRKMVDTRAGFWMLAVTALATVAIVVVIAIVGRAEDHTLSSLLSAAIAPASVLLPVIGVLLASSEWSQRTALITFALVPRRSRVVAAKLLAGGALALAALAIGLVVAAIGVALAGSGGEDRWSLPLGLLGQDAVSLATGMAIGVGFGVLLQASAPAIVAYFLLPIVLGLVGELPAVDGVAGWIDSGRTMVHMTEELLSADEWARVGTTLLLWMVAPVAVGTWRVVHGEVH